MSNSDYRNHPALARKLQAYLRWRNAQGSLPRHAGRPAPRARPHPYLNHDLLVSQWPVLRTLIDKTVRGVWESAFPELREGQPAEP